MSRILVIEDEEIIRKQLTKLLERNNYVVSSAATIEAAIASDPDSFDLILADIRLPGAPGTDILQQVQHAPVVIMTSHASVRSAVDAMKLGAVDYVSKPFDHAELLLVIERALRQNRLSAQNAAMRLDLRRVFPNTELHTLNTPLRQVKEELSNLPADTDCVYLFGERGTGREMLARLIHERGRHTNGPLVIADLPLYQPETMEGLLFGNTSKNICDAEAALASSKQNSKAGETLDSLALNNRHPLGLLRSAQAGTLVLRSIIELPISVQRLLCDWVEQRRASPARSEQREAGIELVLLGTSDVNTALKNNELDQRFAQLFSAAQYAVPALRERTEDIAPLAQEFMLQFLRRYRKRSIRLSDEALSALQAYHWPGNVNELRSLIERAVLSVEANRIEPSHLGLQFKQDGVSSIPLDLTLDGYFRFFVLKHQPFLSETELAQKLGVSRKALWERRQKMNLPRN